MSYIERKKLRLKIAFEVECDPDPFAVDLAKYELVQKVRSWSQNITTDELKNGIVMDRGSRFPTDTSLRAVTSFEEFQEAEQIPLGRSTKR